MVEPRPFDAPLSPVLRGRRVSTPTRHEGLSNALRSAFVPSTEGMDRDIANLLARLD